MGIIPKTASTRIMSKIVPIDMIQPPLNDRHVVDDLVYTVHVTGEFAGQISFSAAVFIVNILDIFHIHGVFSRQIFLGHAGGKTAQSDDALSGYSFPPIQFLCQAAKLLCYARYQFDIYQNFHK